MFYISHHIHHLGLGAVLPTGALGRWELLELLAIIVLFNY